MKTQKKRKFKKSTYKKNRKYKKTIKRGGGNTRHSLETNYEKLHEQLITGIFEPKSYKNKNLRGQYSDESFGEGKSGIIYGLKNTNYHKKYQNTVLKVIGGKKGVKINMKLPLARSSSNTIRMKSNKNEPKSLSFGKDIFPAVLKLEQYFDAPSKSPNKDLVKVYSKKFHYLPGRLKSILRDESVKYRHNDIFYTTKPKNYLFHKYLDMFCCLYDLKHHYQQAIKNKSNDQLGGSPKVSIKINQPPKYNEVIVQYLLKQYLNTLHIPEVKKNFLIDFKDFYISDKEVGIVQEKIGINEEDKTITNLEEYITSKVNGTEDKADATNNEYKDKINDIFLDIIIEKLGIQNKDFLFGKVECQNFFNQLNDLFNEPEKKKITIFIDTYLENFKPNSFFAVMRELFEKIGFLHLDFKLRNIFVRKGEGKPNFSLVIADLDKSRLQIPKDKSKNTYESIMENQNK